MSRPGKIGLLPKNIRDEVHTKLEANVPGREILAWLNPLPEVQQLVARQFEGKPISLVNLSKYRRGVFRKWRINTRIADDFDTFLKRLDDAKRHSGIDLSDNISVYLAFATAKQCAGLAEISQPAERVKHLDELIQSCYRIHHGDYLGERSRVDGQRLGDMGYAADKRRIKDTPPAKLTYDEQRKRIRQVLGIEPRETSE